MVLGRSETQWPGTINIKSLKKTDVDKPRHTSRYCGTGNNTNAWRGMTLMPRGKVSSNNLRPMNPHPGLNEPPTVVNPRHLDAVGGFRSPEKAMKGLDLVATAIAGALISVATIVIALVLVKERLDGMAAPTTQLLMGGPHRHVDTPNYRTIRG
jgi:hypothetical protein